MDHEVVEDGSIMVYLGEEERLCDDLDEALEALGEWAEEYGADPSRPGAIVEFAGHLTKRLASIAPDSRLAAFFDLDLPRILKPFGLVELDLEDFPSVVDDSVLCVVEDGNAACWVVFLDEDDAVSYVAARVGSDEE